MSKDRLVSSSLLGALLGFAVFVPACAISDQPHGSAADSGHPADTSGSRAEISVGPGSTTVSGSVAGTAFKTVASAFWAGNPSAGSAVTLIFLSETPLACSDITVANWDSGPTISQLLELQSDGTTAKTYTVGSGKTTANYLNALTSYNPTATGGTIVLSQINRSQDVVGSYNIDFSGDILSGTFDAVYCAAGREP